MNRTLRTVTVLAAVFVSACEPRSNESLVARAGEYDFTVAEAVELLGTRSDLPNQPGVVRTLAELWIEYTLLADATLADTTYAGVDVDELVEEQVASEMVFALRDSVIRPDTSLSETELQDLFAQEGPDIRVRARHILLGFPDQATTAQRDSVRAQMEGILARIRSGESFEELARTWSQDAGSGAQGGDLGTFGRGEMVLPFEEAAFALEPGEVSGIVETPFGLHIIRVDERLVPTFEGERDRFRSQVQISRLAAAESAYVAGMETEAEPEVQEGAAGLVKEMARSPWTRLARRAADRPLVRYQGGALTVGEVQRFLQSRPNNYRTQVAGAPNQALEANLLLPLAQRELFVRAARDAGFEPGAAHRDSLAAQARTGIGQAARALGLWGLTVPADLDREEAVDRVVSRILTEILDEEREVVPLGPVGFALRRNTESEIFDSGISAAVQRIEGIRGQVPAYTPPTPPDTSGEGAR